MDIRNKRKNMALKLCKSGPVTCTYIYCRCFICELLFLRERFKRRYNRINHPRCIPVINSTRNYPYNINIFKRNKVVIFFLAKIYETYKILTFEY